MSTTLEDARARRILPARPPRLREVCLVGTPARRYRHAGGGPRADGSGPSRGRRERIGDRGRESI